MTPFMRRAFERSSARLAFREGSFDVSPSYRLRRCCHGVAPARSGRRGCSHTDPLNVVTPPEEAGAPSSRSPTPVRTSSVDAGLTAYCPATSCPAPFATCSSSRFPCDVDLIERSGRCGENARGTREQVRGECDVHVHRREVHDEVPTRARSRPIATASSTTIARSRSARTTTAMRAEIRVRIRRSRRIFNRLTGEGRCGCEPGKVLCGSSCVDPSVDDSNCSACGIERSRPAENADWPANGRYGCLGGRVRPAEMQHGLRGLRRRFARTAARPTSSPNDRCGSCNNACAAGKTCGYNAQRQIDALVSDGPDALLTDAASTSRPIRTAAEDAESIARPLPPTRTTLSRSARTVRAITAARRAGEIAMATRRMAAR